MELEAFESFVFLQVRMTAVALRIVCCDQIHKHNTYVYIISLPPLYLYTSTITLQTLYIGIKFQVCIIT